MLRIAPLALILLVSPAEGRAEGAPGPETCRVAPIWSQLEASPDLIALGRDLFYDPILSGNRSVACATCHHPVFGTSDGVALSLGDGGIDLGPARQADPDNAPERRIPRNAPALFNLGHDEFSVLFHDGRVERLPDGTIRTPQGNLPDRGALSVLSALSRFPVLSPDEMAGHYSENPIAAAVRRGLFDGPGGAHRLLADRVASIEGYRRRFAHLTGATPTITYDDIARALAAFMAHEWRADDSAFDRHLCQGRPLPLAAAAGMTLFYGKAGCGRCHAGRFQTDHAFHAIAMPQIGPGKAERFETHARDTGRMRVTGNVADAYRFRTPSLRNVALTPPYGHAGAYGDLRAVIRHHLDPTGALSRYTTDKVTLPVLAGAADFVILRSDVERAAIAQANELAPVDLTEHEIDQLIAFLHSLTDRRGAVGRLGVPVTVPSGLPVPRP